jgi:hypothetical protein
MCDERIFWVDTISNTVEILLLMLVFVALWRAGTTLRSMLHALRRISRGDTRPDITQMVAGGQTASGTAACGRTRVG